MSRLRKTVVFLAASTVVWATVVSATHTTTGTFSACYDKAGNIRLIGEPGLRDECPRGWTAFSFNREGQPGAPGAPQQVAVITSTGAVSTGDYEKWNDWPEAHTSIDVPLGRDAIVLVSFSGHSKCKANGPEPNSTWACAVRILVGGDEALPHAPPAWELLPFDGGYAPRGDLWLDVDDAFEAHSIDRSLRVGPGSHAVKAQARVSAPGVTLEIRAWHMTVQVFLLE